MTPQKHELAKLKGVDRVVMPQDVYKMIEKIGDSWGVIRVGYCVCGEDVREDTDKYCSYCGRKLLWEKVK